MDGPSDPISEFHRLVVQRSLDGVMPRANAVKEGAAVSRVEPTTPQSASKDPSSDASSPKSTPSKDTYRVLSEPNTKRIPRRDCDSSESETDDVTVITGIDRVVKNYIKRNGPILHQNRTRLSKALYEFQSKTRPSKDLTRRWISSFWPGEKRRQDIINTRIENSVTSLLHMTDWSCLPETHRRQWWFGPDQTAPTGALISSVKDRAQRLLREMSDHGPRFKETTEQPSHRAFDELCAEVEDVTLSLQQAQAAVRE